VFKIVSMWAVRLGCKLVTKLLLKIPHRLKHVLHTAGWNIWHLFVCLSVCLSVCLLMYLKNRMSKLHEIFCMCLLPVVVALSFSDDSAMRYVLLVLWMTSYFPVIGHIMCTALALAMWALQKQVVNIFSIVFDFVFMYSGSKLCTMGEVWCLWLLC